MAARESQRASSPVGEKAGGEGFPAAATNTGAARLKRFLGLFKNGKALAISLPLFVLVTWVFLPALRGGFIEFDDSVYVADNTRGSSGLTWGNIVWALGNGVAGNWHPLTVWSLMLDCQIYGLKPWGYHLTNVLLHAVNTVLAFLVFRRMTGATWRSLLVAVLFGLHPLRVESVAWISERKDVLSALFWLLTLWAYARFAEDSKAGSRRAKCFYGLGLACFALGLMSKPMVVTLPCALLLLDYWPLARWNQESWRRLVVEKLPFFLLAAAVSVITYIVQKRGGMMSQMAGLPLNARWQNALVSYGRYLGKLFWPVDLCAHYFHPGYWPAGKVLLAGGLVLSLSVLAWVRRRPQPWWLIGWLWYLGTLVPMIGLVQVGTQSMADRYTYIPCLGVLIALVWGAGELTRSWRCQTVGLSATGGVLALVCIALTRHQIGFWKDGVNVWTRAVAVTEDNYDAHVRLGRALGEQGHTDEAIREFQEAVRLNPGFAEGYLTLGGAFSDKGRIDEAIACYRKALELRPDYVAAHINLGTVLFQQGQLDEALAYFQAALKIQTDYEVTLANIGSVYFRMGRTDEAIAEFRKALSLKPDSVKIHNNLGYALEEKGQLDQAITEYRKALSLKPDFAEVHTNLASAHFKLGLALAQKGQLDDAILHFQQALEIRPLFAIAHNDLGYALLRRGRLDEALVHLQEAVDLEPNAVACRNFGFALLLKGQVDEAIAEFRQALSLKPDDAEASNDLASALARKKAATVPPAAKAKP